MTRRTLFQRMIAAAAGCVLAKTPLAGAMVDVVQPETDAVPLTAFDEFHRILREQIGADVIKLLEYDCNDPGWNLVETTTYEAKKKVDQATVMAFFGFGVRA